jgi:D12 class N6 adenine-specific DNA methyltransferase
VSPTARLADRRPGLFGRGHRSRRGAAHLPKRSIMWRVIAYSSSVPTSPSPNRGGGDATAPCCLEDPGAPKPGPFLKWPGGKRWLVASHPQLLPRRYGRYIEPFLGAGSVFFHLRPQEALLGDLNADLITAYRGITMRTAPITITRSATHCHQHWPRRRRA